MVGTKPNSGSFKKGLVPWNKGKRMNLDLTKIYSRHIAGESIMDISKELGVSDRLIRIRLEEAGCKVRNDRKEISRLCSNKTSKTQFKKGIFQLKVHPHKPNCKCFNCTGYTWNKGKHNMPAPWNKGKTGLQKSYKKGKKFEEIYDSERCERLKKIMKENRRKQIFPVKDTKIELKMQNLLRELGIEFYTHQYIKEIEHAYQCDIFIPVQEKITRPTIIECFGTYWHNYPTSRPIDVQRCSELRTQGFRVLVFWENEIKVMELNDLKNKLSL